MDAAVTKAGARIRLLRSARNISQYALAEAWGIIQTNLSNIDNGRTAAILKNLFKACELSGCTMADFFDEELPQRRAAGAPLLAAVAQALKVLQQVNGVKQGGRT